MYNNYFQHKIILVTGGGSGIGRGLCLQLAAEGAIVFCTDIDLTKANETVSMAINGNVISQNLDVAIEAKFETVIAEIVNRYGRLDLIFNNAGIAVSGEIRDIDISQWKKAIDVNFYGVLNGSQIAYRQMLKQGSGQIVNIASAAGLVDYLGLMAPYSVTKHAVVNYTKILRLEAKALGIKANVVCPGFISTSIGANAINPNANRQWNDYAIELVAKGISIEKAINKILAGVAANKEVIIFPFQAKIIYCVTQLFTGLYKMTMQKVVKDYREKYRLPTS
ncbi:SDR family NAD(P)-dependent oxidoreductase [Mucilaginibacter sp. X4EP1]|uniref:SDR family NAD(P)-dependent oxidoreductase n=1 Tax=Mucilaginibacter sp. X4EP1 TaxID=2723092 RepID=UPI002169C69E|nr:SDR family oxidoreductase [Mucilaginibacter sp. X4EP1]MCS3816368.1 NAD(P)-dependent dehydrogenase (short-subunit alcohol dehydrogenase family) [Mucilaginibacter sp. X4EP1]